MGHSVTITTPIPTLDEVARSLRLSKKDQKELLEIAHGTAQKPRTSSRRKASKVRRTNTTASKSSA